MVDNKHKKVGLNILYLRHSFGETQEDLAYAVNVSKSAISQYECGKKTPTRDHLDDIAHHYLINTDELIYDDFSFLNSIDSEKKIDLFNLSKEEWIDNAELLFPIISSEKALLNEDFETAFTSHKAIYNVLCNNPNEFIYYFDIIDKKYETAKNDKSIKVEASANQLAIWYILLWAINISYTIQDNKEIAINLPNIIKNSIFPSNFLTDLFENDASTYEEIKSLYKIITSDKMDRIIQNNLITVKNSKEYSDLADYYLALQYILNIVNNNLNMTFNKRIGLEMMDAFMSLGNPYANKLNNISKKAQVNHRCTTQRR